MDVAVDHLWPSSLVDGDLVMLIGPSLRLTDDTRSHTSLSSSLLFTTSTQSAASWFWSVPPSRYIFIRYPLIFCLLIENFIKILSHLLFETLTFEGQGAKPPNSG